MKAQETQPLPTTVQLDALLELQRAAFLETQREMARIARRRIEGDAIRDKRIMIESKSRSE